MLKGEDVYEKDKVLVDLIDMQMKRLLQKLLSARQEFLERLKHKVHSQPELVATALLN